MCHEWVCDPLDDGAVGTGSPRLPVGAPCSFLLRMLLPFQLSPFDRSAMAKVSVLSTVSVTPCEPPPHISVETYVSQSLWRPAGARGVFGGQVIAQALAAASHTIAPPLGLHSQHCYFLLPADARQPIIYAVERLRDGKSYATRHVKAWQGQKAVFVLMASYASSSHLPTAKGEIPFAFVPTSQHLVKKPKEEQGRNASSYVSNAIANNADGSLSHSLRFAVEASTSNPTSKLESPARAKRWRQRRTDIPRFSETYQTVFPADALPYEQCEEEEIRWTAILERDDMQDERRRSAIKEYIQVSHLTRLLMAYHRL
jgi:acyl-CoA thioesterase 8